MTSFTAHTRAASPPVLVPERFSWGALILGPVWLAAHRAWVAGAVVLLLDLAAGVVPEPAWRPWLTVALALLVGLLGQDLRRWTLARRGFLLAHVVVAGDPDEALARLVAARPDLLQAALR